METVKLITRSKFELNDYQFNVGNLVVDETSGFNLEKSETRILPYANRMWNSITYEMSLTRRAYSRTVYSFLDFLSDIGGLFSALGPLGGVIITIFYSKSDNLFIMRSMLSNEL